MFHPADGDPGFALHDFGALEMLNDRVPATYRLSEEGTRELMRGDGQASATQTHEGNAGASFGLKPQVGAHSVRRVRRRVEASIRRLGLRFVEGPPRNDDGTVTWPGTGDKPGTDRYWDPYIGRLENPDRDFRVHVEMDPSRDEATGRVEELYERCEQEDRDDPESPECKPHLRVQVVPGAIGRSGSRYDRQNRAFVQDLVLNEPAIDAHVIPGDPNANRQEAAILVSEPVPVARLLQVDGIRVRFTGRPETHFTANRVLGSLTQSCTPPVGFPTTVRDLPVSAVEGTAIHPGSYQIAARLLPPNLVSGPNALDVRSCRTTMGDITLPANVESPVLSTRGQRLLEQGRVTPANIGVAVGVDAGEAGEAQAIEDLCRMLSIRYPRLSRPQHLAAARGIYPLVFDNLRRFFRDLGIGVTIFEKGPSVSPPQLNVTINYRSLATSVGWPTPSTCSARGTSIDEQTIAQALGALFSPERPVRSDACVQADRLLLEDSFASAVYGGYPSETTPGAVCTVRGTRLVNSVSDATISLSEVHREIALGLAATTAHEIGHQLGLRHLAGYEEFAHVVVRAADTSPILISEAGDGVERTPSGGTPLTPECRGMASGRSPGVLFPRARAQASQRVESSSFLMVPGDTLTFDGTCGIERFPYSFRRLALLRNAITPQLALSDADAGVRARGAVPMMCGGSAGGWPVPGLADATSPNTLDYLRTQYPR